MDHLSHTMHMNNKLQLQVLPVIKLSLGVQLHCEYSQTDKHTWFPGGS